MPNPKPKFKKDEKTGLFTDLKPPEEPDDLTWAMDKLKALVEDAKVSVAQIQAIKLYIEEIKDQRGGNESGINIDDGWREMGEALLEKIEGGEK